MADPRGPEVMATGGEEDRLLREWRLDFGNMLGTFVLCVAAYFFLLFTIFSLIPPLQIAWVILGLVYVGAAVNDIRQKTRKFLRMDEARGTAMRGENHAFKWWLWGMLVFARESHAIVVRNLWGSNTGPSDFLRWKGVHVQAWDHIVGFREIRETLGFIVPVWHVFVEAVEIRIIDPDFPPFETRTADGQTVRLDTRTPVSVVNPVVFAARISGMSWEEKRSNLEKRIVRQRIQDTLGALASQLSIDTLMRMPFAEFAHALRGRVGRAPSLRYKAAFAEYERHHTTRGTLPREEERSFTEEGPRTDHPLALPVGRRLEHYGWSFSSRLETILRVEVGFEQSVSGRVAPDPDDAEVTPPHIFPGGYLSALNDELLLLSGAAIPLTRFRLQNVILPEGIIAAAEQQTRADMARGAAESSGKALRAFTQGAGIPEGSALYVALADAYARSQSGRGIYETPQQGSRPERTSGGGTGGESSSTPPPREQGPPPGRQPRRGRRNK